MKQESCKARIQDEWSSRKADFTTFMRSNDLENVSDELGSFYDYGLSFDYVDNSEEYDDNGESTESYFEYLLSWGGPSDLLRFYSSGRVEYRFHDWFDGAGIDVTGDECIDWLKDMFEVEYLFTTK